MALGSIVVRLTMNTADFDTDTARAAKIAERRAKEIDASFRKASLAIGLALGAAAVGAAVAIKNTINTMDDLSKAAQRANVPTEEFTSLAYAGGLADVAVQDLTSAMGRLANAQADSLKATSQQARVFKALGIETKDAEGNLRSTYDVFLDFADAFQAQRGSPEIMAAGMDIFGRSFQNLIPLLKDGSAGLRAAAEEGRELNLVFNDAVGAKAERSTTT